MPLSIATLGPLPKRDIAAGAGIYSLTRQLGSSIGIAIITSLLAFREVVHRTVLVQHEGLGDPGTMRRLGFLQGAFARASSDPVAVHRRALKLLDIGIDQQALLLSFSDIFMYVAIAFTASLPLLLLLGRGKNRQAAAAAH
jgi:DHA2 family multidrug resistance protein